MIRLARWRPLPLARWRPLPLARWRPLPAVALGAVALGVLGLVVATSATGEARTPGAFQGGNRLIAESFRSPAALDPNGDFQWTIEAGAWSLNGADLVADEVPAHLQSGRDVPQNYGLGVSWAGDAEGAWVGLSWDEDESWVFRVTSEGYEFAHLVDGEETVISRGDIPETSAAGPSVLLTRTSSTISVELIGSSIEDRRRVASVDHLVSPNTNVFSVGSDRAGVRFARIEAELPPI